MFSKDRKSEMLLGVIEAYISHPRKAEFRRWQIIHHHGSKGMRRARHLKSFHLLAVANDESGRSLNKLYLAYMNKNISYNLLRGIADGQYTHKELIDNVSLLNGGNDHASSLRTYIKNFYENFGNTLSLGIPFNHDILDNSNAFINLDDLRLQRSINDSAHTINIYSDNLNNTYFGKEINDMSDIPKYIAEIIYSETWRWFLGERISKSIILLDKYRNICGICSRGLNDFIEWKNIKNKGLSNIKGIISIIFYAYLLMENDLHTKNIGLTKPSGYPYPIVGKIDHDYIASKWKNNGRDIEDTFPINNLLFFMDKPSPRTFIPLFKYFRFSPGTENSFPLIACHTMRRKPKTTINGVDSNLFLKMLSTPYSQDEMEKVKLYFNLVNIKNLDNHLKRILLIFRNYDTRLAKEIKKSLLGRISYLKSDGRKHIFHKVIPRSRYHVVYENYL
jgi:hypothetical protein